MEKEFNYKLQQEKMKTQNMARALYDSGYPESHAIEAIKSKGYSEKEAIQINFAAYQELHFERRKTFRTVAWISGILMIAFITLGIYFEIQESQLVIDKIQQGRAESIGNHTYLVHGNFDQNKTALKAGMWAAIAFTLNFLRYQFVNKPKFKKITSPVENPF